MMKKRGKRSTIGSPNLGASFVDYFVTIYAEGKNELGFGESDIETLLYVLDGSLKVKAGAETHFL